VTAVCVRYRKVAADNCEGGPLVGKYQSVQVSCPVMKPAGLNIEVGGGDVVAVHRNVNFSLIQDQVSHFLYSVFSSAGSTIRISKSCRAINFFNRVVNSINFLMHN